MKRSSAALAVLALSAFVSPGCQSAGADIDDHWNFRSVPPRMARYILGYDSSRDGNYRDFAWERKASINMTLRRHMLNDNPENPFKQADEGLYEPRPLNSILPNPLNYIHVEGFLIGWALTGVLFPIPVDSLIGTFEPGGKEEFVQGLNESFYGKGVITASDGPALYELELEEINERAMAEGLRDASVPVTSFVRF